MSVLQKLTEGVQSRDLQAEGQALLNKWEATGLLEGLNEGQAKQGMAVLLENQAKELLREASSMAAGDVEGFAAVAFPIVRRVFGGLIANDLISVQPMSLPSGLIFFLDFTHNTARGGIEADSSLYGGNVVGSQITGGVNFGSSSLGNAGGPGGHYDLGYAYTAPTGTLGDTFQACTTAGSGLAAVTAVSASALTDDQKKAIMFDPDILALSSSALVTVAESDGSFAALRVNGQPIDAGHLHSLTIPALDATEMRLVRRLTRVVNDRLVIVITSDTGDAAVEADDHIAAVHASLSLRVPIADNFVTGGALGSVAGAHDWAMEGANNTAGGGEGVFGGDKDAIPEIDIKVDSIAVTAQTKKLKAKWTPELGQDLNAYHNLDAEVELTGILSEQIALEIDRELLGELVRGATAGTRYWSRAPGLFVDSEGRHIGANTAAPDFTGTVSEWYETLIETINDVSAQIHRKTLRGGANFVVCSPEVANILEFTSGFRAAVTADQDRGTIGAVRAGSLSKKFDVYVDPYFLRNVLLVGRKGSSFLESGFVYAPYVPLQVTPTIFGTEDFVPRKGVMTRYAKKMVRPDMYGLVVVRGLLGDGSTNG